MSLYATRSSLRGLALTLLVVGLPVPGFALPTPFADGVSGGAVHALPAIALALDGDAYLIGEFEPEYAEPHPDHPPLDSVRTAEITLGKVADGYVAPREGIPTVEVTLEQIAEEEKPAFYYASAIAAINQGILMELNRKGLGGVRVQTNPADIDPATGEDKRIPVVQETVRVEVQTGRIGDLRVVEIEGFGFGDVAENEVERIKAGSPIQPAGGSAGGTDLLRTDLLKNYVAELNRHPGRRVVAEISPSRITPGVAYLDYKVVEEKSWAAYYQLSNTGTEETHLWRSRFGYRNTQVSGRDDIFRLDYITDAGFDGDTQAVFGSYDAPLPGLERTRFKLSGAFADYNASDVGFSDSNFEGTQYQGGLELVRNVLQDGDLFLDLFVGMDYKDVYVENHTVSPITKGNEAYGVPKLGFRVSRTTDAMSFDANGSWNASLGNLSQTELEELGRPTDIDTSWQILRWDTSLSAFVEPALARVVSSVDPGARVNEIYLSFRGQSALGNRLIPQETMIAGGLYSVRGYPQATLAGDSVYLTRAEYRLHVPRLLSVQPKPMELPILGDFRVARQHARGRPDWDLVLSAFTDAGWVRQSHKVAGEIDGSLWGAGVGLELRIRRNLSIVYNFGVALRDVAEVGGDEGHRVDSGDYQNHLSFTVLY